jgi:hypothetical protein
VAEPLTYRDLDMRRVEARFRAELLAGGQVLLLRILLRHARLFEMGRVLVPWAASKEWQARPDGSYLFRFARRRPDST